MSRVLVIEVEKILTVTWKTGHNISDHAFTSNEVCFAACRRWVLICRANSLVGVIIRAKRGLLILSLPELLLIHICFPSSDSWLAFCCRMCVRIGIPNARVLPDPCQTTRSIRQLLKESLTNWEHHMLNRAPLLSAESNFTFTLVLLYYSPWVV